MYMFRYHFCLPKIVDVRVLKTVNMLAGNNNIGASVFLYAVILLSCSNVSKKTNILLIINSVNNEELN